MAISRRRASRSSVATPATTRFIEPRYRYIQSSLFSVRSKFDIFLFIVFIFFCIRIVFMSGGYLELVEKKNQVSKKKEELAWINKDNTSVKNEIKSIKTSSSYQRKLAREHLGVIGPDEYLVLFASDLAKTPN